MKESDIMRKIMAELSLRGHMVFRGNIGLFYTKNGIHIRSGLPNGFSDLFGHRKGDGRAFYLEVKAAKGKVSNEQERFIEAVIKHGAIAGVVRSVEDAINLVEDKDYASLCTLQKMPCPPCLSKTS